MVCSYWPKNARTLFPNIKRIDVKKSSKLGIFSYSTNNNTKGGIEYIYIYIRLIEYFNRFLAIPNCTSQSGWSNITHLINLTCIVIDLVDLTNIF